MKPSLIVVCGHPLSGKSTLAGELSRRLGVHWIDLDQLRVFYFGPADPEPNLDAATTAKDKAEVAAAYNIIFHAVELYCREFPARSLIVSLPLSSRRFGQDVIQNIAEQYSRPLRILWCNLRNATPETIDTRLRQRLLDGYRGAVNSRSYFLECRDRFEPIELQCCQIDTSPPATVEETVQLALNYLAA